MAERPAAGRLVALIDSGVDPANPLLRGATLLAGEDLTGAVGDGRRDACGHGSAVAAAILHLCPDAALLPLRVFGDEPAAPFERVLAALERALSGVWPVAIVNLSLGTTALQYRQPLQELVDAARGRGIRLVAPAAMAGVPCDPGNLAGVDAVVPDWNAPPALPRLSITAGRSIWYASPTVRPWPGQTTPPRVAGESIAAGYVSGHLLRGLPR